MLALLLLAACTGDRTVECTTAPDDRVPQAPHVTWETPRSGSSWVEYTWGGGEDASVPIDDDDVLHDVPIVGVPPLTDVSFTAITQAGRASWRCEGTVRTCNIPAETPEISVTVDDRARESSEPFLLGSVIDGDTSSQFAIDRAGVVRWLTVEDTLHFTMMSKPGRNGGIIANRFTREPWFRHGELHWGPLVGEDTRTETDATDGSHHVFLELPDGTVAFMRIDVRDAELSDGPHTIVGDEVVELAPDGTVRSLFSTWDHLEVRDELTTHQAYWPEGFDWTHGNSLFYVAERDSLLFSMANVATIVEIDRATGAVTRSYRGSADWTLAGDDYTVASGEPFRHQHDAHLSEAGTLLAYVTEADTDYTLAIEYAIDDDAKTLTEVWRHQPDPPVRNWALGQVQELANGNRLIASNFAGLVEEVTPDGTVVWEAHTPLNVVFGQVYLVDELPR
jgi:hypothetical protein